MASDKRKKFIRNTPEGIAMFPYLLKPDTKYNADGEYKVDLKMSRDEAEELITDLNKLRDAFHVVTVEEAKPADKKRIGVAEVFHEVFDDAGDVTNDVFFRFKMKANVNPKNGEAFSQKPNGFDAKGKPWDVKTGVYGGSRLVVNFEAVPYYTAKDKVVGVTLRLRAFQVKELVSGRGGSADQYGFGSSGSPEDDHEDDQPFAGGTVPDADEDF